MSISVVIPAYNAAEFISQTLNSALRQTVPIEDIIVVDDESTDDTAAIAAAFPTPVRVFTIANCKQGAARNFGVSKAETEWVAFLDADDLWEPDKLKLQMEELARHPQAGLCYTGHIDFSDNNGVISYKEPVLGPMTPQLARELYVTCPFLPSSTVIKRSVLHDVGGFSPDPGVVEDWDLWLRLHRAGVQFVGCREPLFFYRRHPNSFIASDRLRMSNKHIRLFREQIMPYVRGLDGLRATQTLSALIADSSFLMWHRNDPDYLGMLMSSILSCPIEPKPYKILVKILLSRFTTIRDLFPSWYSDLT